MRLAERWALLGIEPTDDKRAVRMAYTRRLKETDVDSDPTAFIRLREALDEALYWGTEKPVWEEEDWSADPEQWVTADDIQVDYQADPDDILLDEREWHPDLPASAEDRLSGACAELDRLLFAEGEADPARIAALGDEVLSDPELANVGRATEIEHWLAQLIPAAAPRSDPLIEPALARFGWRRSRKHWRRDYEVEAVLERRDAIRFLARAESIHVQRVALRELRGPARTRLEWDNLSLAREVRDFLALIDSKHPSALRDLNPGSLAWWRDYLAGPHLPAGFWSILLMTPLAVTLFGLVIAANVGGNLLGALLLYPPAMLVTYVAILVSARIRMKVRQRKEQFWMADRHSAAVPALMLAALALPSLTALAPDTRLAGLMCGLAALLIVGILWWRILPGARLMQIAGSGFLPGVAAVCTLLLPFAVPEQSFFKALTPLAALCLLGYWTSGAVQMWLVERGGRSLAAIGAAAILCLAAGFLTTRSVVGWPPPLWVLVLVPVAIVAAHLATAASNVHLWEWPLRICALILYWSLGAIEIAAFDDRLLFAIYSYGLVYSFVKLVLAGAEALRPRRPETL